MVYSKISPIGCFFGKTWINVIFGLRGMGEWNFKNEFSELAWKLLEMISLSDSYF